MAFAGAGGGDDMNVDCMGFEFTPQLVLALISVVVLVRSAMAALWTVETARLRPLPVDAAVRLRWPWRDRLSSVPPGLGSRSRPPRPRGPRPRRDCGVAPGCPGQRWSDSCALPLRPRQAA
jgi:hypothetical protein